MAWKVVPFKPIVKPVVNAVRYSRLMPLRWHLSLSVFHIVACGYGHLRSAARMAMLVNSEWFYEASAILRGAGLIEGDMTGFAPINDYTSTTSFYFDRCRDDYALLRLDKSNYKLVIAELETRAHTTVASVGENK